MAQREVKFDWPRDQLLGRRIHWPFRRRGIRRESKRNAVSLIAGSAQDEYGGSELISERKHGCERVARQPLTRGSSIPGVLGSHGSRPRGMHRSHYCSCPEVSLSLRTIHSSE